MSEDLLFRAEPAVDPERRVWRLLIVDDDTEVHVVTKLALDGFRFAGRDVEFLHAYSAREAREQLAAHPDIALVLLDVVMETENAGLGLVEYIRDTLHNPFIRIVLRTGQPGQAPEHEVITRYDINDYKYKTELTRERLFTTIYTGLSTYRDLIALDANRRGLEKVLEASSRIFDLRTVEYLAQGVLEQLTALLFLDRDAVILHAAGVATRADSDELEIVAGTGAYAAHAGKNPRDVLPAVVLERILLARGHPGAYYGADYFVGDHPGEEEGELIFYLGANRTMSRPEGEIIEKFCRHVGIAYDNLLKLTAARGRRQKDRDPEP